MNVFLKTETATLYICHIETNTNVPWITQIKQYEESSGSVTENQAEFARLYRKEGKQYVWWHPRGDGDCLFYCLACVENAYDTAVLPVARAQQMRDELVADLKNDQGKLKDYYQPEVRKVIADAVAVPGACSGFADSLVEYVTVAQEIKLEIVDEYGGLRKIGNGRETNVILARTDNYFSLLVAQAG